MSQDPLVELQTLYAELERATAPLEQRHESRLNCRRGCSQCCVDELTVFAIEAEHIRRHAGTVLAEPPGPRGACAFLDGEGACRIYPWRPYVCRTQGLPLRWLEEDEESEDVFEYRDICPLNEAGEPIEELDEDACWTIGPIEEHLARLQHTRSGNGQRIALRDLFQDSPVESASCNLAPPGGVQELPQLL